MSRVLKAIGRHPWVITEEWLHTIIEVANRASLTPDQVERERGKPLENTFSVRVRDGVAIIPVHGPLFRFANLFMRISGGTSYEELGREIGAAVDDPTVRGIILDVDSPGGEVFGTQELGELIYRARAEKPIKTFVTGFGASGGYWIASSAEEVVIGSTAMVGSIGTVLTYIDDSKRMEMEGLEEIEIISSQSPKKRPNPAEADGLSQIQVWLDDLAQVFIETVARNRGVSTETVLSEFGQGDMMVGQAAIDAGLADRIGTLEDLILEMQASGAGAGRVTLVAEEATMPKEQEQGAPAAEQPVIDRAYLEANHEDLVAEIRAEGAAEATTAERERVQAIRKLPAKGHEELVAKAIDEGWSSGRAAEAILAAEGQKAQGKLDAMKGDEEELNAPEADAAGTDVDPDSTEGQAARLMGASRRIRRAASE